MILVKDNRNILILTLDTDKMPVKVIIKNNKEESKEYKLVLTKDKKLILN